MAEKKQQLVLSIIEFLETSISDGSIKSDDKEGIEIAIQCIGEAFGVDPSDQAQKDKLSVKPATLASIFDVYLKTKDKVGSQAAGSSSTPAAAATTGPSAADKEKAEKHKQEGNNLMAAKEYQKAVDAYTEAIALDPNNPVYYSNRAAAWSSMGDHAVAVDDAEMAIAVDPKFVKAYSRLGHAHFILGDYEAAKSAFERGLVLEPNNSNLKVGLTNATTKLATAPRSSSSSAPASGAGDAGGFDWSQMASMMGGLGGGAGAGAGAGRGGGMPDLASLMNNPAMMQMAQQMMANGGMDRLMSNPAIRNIAERAQSGGGMPSMAEIMADPQLREMASNFMGGAGRGGPGAGNV